MLIKAFLFSLSVSVAVGQDTVGQNNLRNKFLPTLESQISKQAIKIEWDKNPELDISGYWVSVGRVSGQYDEKVWVKDPNYSITIGDVSTGRRYYIVVTAVNQFGVESPPSDEVKLATGEITKLVFLPDKSAKITLEGVSGWKTNVAYSNNNDVWRMLKTYTNKVAPFTVTHTNPNRLTRQYWVIDYK